MGGSRLAAVGVWRGTRLRRTAYGFLPSVFSTQVARIIFQGMACWLAAVALAAANPSPAWPRILPDGQESAVVGRPALSAEVGNNQGQLVLLVTNRRPQDLPLIARLRLGTEAEMKEIGQVAFTIPAGQTLLYGLKGMSISGSHYILALYQDTKLILYQHAPLRGMPENQPTAFLTIQPSVAGKHSLTTAGVSGNPATAGSPIVASAPREGSGNFVPPPEVQLQARLLAGEKENESFVLSFELFSERPIFMATLAISLGKFKESKPVSINKQSILQFQLPETIEEETVYYTLTSKEGRLLLKGDLLLSKLMEEDFVSVTDIRLDQPGYAAGEVARVLFILDGKARAGYRIEIGVRDGRGNTFHRDQRLVPPDSQDPSQEFSFTLPAPLAGPIVLEYRIFDSQSGALYDSGEREIPLAH